MQLLTKRHISKVKHDLRLAGVTGLYTIALEMSLSQIPFAKDPVQKVSVPNPCSHINRQYNQDVDTHVTPFFFNCSDIYID